MKLHGHLVYCLMFCFHCSSEGLIKITERSSTLSYRYQLVNKNRTWNAAHLYCDKVYHDKLVVIANLVDQLALMAYVDKLLGQLTYAA